MAAHGQADHGTELTGPLQTGPVDFDTPAKKGWDFFTKFILWNIIVIIVTLLFIGVLTVWS